MSDCYDPTHFIEVDGAIMPAPWMQWRQVAGVSVRGKSGAYNVTGGGNKDELLHNLTTRWKNDTPVQQWCYGLITRGGQRVTLQARSRGGLVTRSAHRREHLMIDDHFETLDPRWTFAPTHGIIDAATSFDGVRRLQISPNAAAQVSTWGVDIPVNPGDKVRASVQVRKDAAFNGAGVSRIRLGHATPANTFWSAVTFASLDMPAANTWYPRTGLFTVPADGSLTKLRLQVQTDNTAGIAWLDALRVIVSPEMDPNLPLVVSDSSIFGVGGDLGRGGVLAIGTSFAIPEVRMNSTTFGLAPERTGWALLDPGEELVAATEVRFVTQQWENTTVDGGDSESESSYDTGDTRLDLFALPVIT